MIEITISLSKKEGQTDDNLEREKKVAEKIEEVIQEIVKERNDKEDRESDLKMNVETDRFGNFENEELRTLALGLEVVLEGVKVNDNIPKYVKGFIRNRAGRLKDEIDKKIAN